MSSMDPGLPPLVTQPLGVALEHIQRYGFFVLVASILLYVAYRYYSEWNHHRQVYDPSRVSRLTEKTRERRLAQQAAWQERAADVIQHEAKTKPKVVTKQDRLYRPKAEKPDDSDDDWYRKKDPRGPALSAWDAAGGNNKNMKSNIRGVLRPGGGCNTGS